jgi:hypothetical protein
MKVLSRFCKICAKVVSWIVGEPVMQKKEMYFITCEKGHISKMFISKNLMDVLNKEK